MSETADLVTTLALTPGASLARTEEGLALKGPRFEHDFNTLPPAAADALLRLSRQPEPERGLTAAVAAGAGLSGLMGFGRVKFQLETLGALATGLWLDGAALATLVPMAAGSPLASGSATADRAYALSRFAYLSRDGDRMQLCCPLGSARLVFHDPRVAALCAAMAEARRPDALGRCSGLPEPAVLGLLDMILHMGAALSPSEAPPAEEDMAGPLGAWEFHDLLFHARTRLDRHDAAFGGTFPMKGRVPPPPVVEPRPWSHDIVLPEPDMAALRAADPPFAEVVESRRSIRQYGPPPTVAQLGEFLFRTARIASRLALPAGEMQLSLRPTPGGGAIHEIELYLIVDACAGLARGLYHYDALGHRLGLVRAADAATEALLEIAWTTADRKSRPHIAFTLTARFQRLQWKYQTVAYSVILKNVGALYQSMYLAATAMGLAPCALGGGTLDRFCAAAGLDPYRESPVGEFVLGGRGEAAP